MENGKEPNVSQQIDAFEIVRIGDGQRILPPYMETYWEHSNSYSPLHSLSAMSADNIMGVRAVLQGGLKKDGTPSKARSAHRILVRTATDRWLRLHDYVRFDEARETRALPLRAEIARALAALQEAESRLLSLYREMD